MRVFKDDRGRSYNDIFPDIGTGDINISVLYPGTIKAFHLHKHQDDWWFCARGNFRAVLVDPRGTLPVVTIHYFSEGDLLHIPAGVYHGVQNFTQEEAILVYHITQSYDPENPDEERVPWDQFYDWSISRK